MTSLYDHSRSLLDNLAEIAPIPLEYLRELVAASEVLNDYVTVQRQDRMTAMALKKIEYAYGITCTLVDSDIFDKDVWRIRPNKLAMQLLEHIDEKAARLRQDIPRVSKAKSPKRRKAR